ncbi:MAG: hypothetical protein H7Y86_13360 [Rhizobacter sp.]|nr:hypothetical protein [Ferruginibacter sp.]
MKSIIKQVFLPLVSGMLILSACTEKKAGTQEELEIQKMDSTAKTLKETGDKLEDQTRKVESSLEKLDKEFESNN